MTAGAATAAVDAETFEARPESPSRLAWRRLRRDKAALGSAAFLILLVFAVLPGAPILGAIVGHGPNDLFPYAVDVSLRPVGPLSFVPDTGQTPDIDPVTFEHTAPPPGTGKTLLILGADGQLGRDELLRLLYGGRVSLIVAVGATLLALLIGTTLGTLAAYLALAQDLGCAGPRAWTSHLILPWITFALFFLAIYTRLVRVRMLEVMEEPFIRTAAAKGASRTRIVRGHALRNAMGPVLALVGMDVGLALGIALYVESVYRLPGLGLTTLGALNGQVGFDLPMILGIVFVIGIVIVVINFAIDLAIAWMDPRAAEAGTRRTAVGRIA